MSDQDVINFMEKLKAQTGGELPDLGQAAGPGNIPAPFAELAGAMGQLEQTTIQLMQHVQMMAESMDVMRLSNDMYARIMVEKEIITKEEIKEYFEENVVQVLQKAREAQMQQFERMQNEAKAEMENQVGLAPEVEEDCEPCGDCKDCEEECECEPVLASEKAGEVIKFGKKEEEDE